MPAAPQPDNEMERLEVLQCYCLLDTPPEEALIRFPSLRQFGMKLLALLRSALLASALRDSNGHPN